MQNSPLDNQEIKQNNNLPEPNQIQSEEVAEKISEKEVNATDTVSAPQEAIVEKKMSIQEQWNDFVFDEKQYVNLNEQLEIVLKGNHLFPERILTTVHPDTWTNTIQLLIEKFSDVNLRSEELFKEWETTEDKLKLVGKIVRLKEYLNNANAIGNYEPLVEKLNACEQQIKAIYESNYAERLKLVEEAEGLINSEEWKETTENFRKLIETWKTSAPIEKEKNDQLWEKLDKARNQFFERKRQHQEGIEQEMMQNLDLKLEICEQAEKLTNSEDWKKTTDDYKEMMDKWRGIGRVISQEKNDELWNRFNEARNQFFERKRHHFNIIQKEQEDNYVIKLSIVEKAEALKESTDWKETSDAYAELNEQWKNTGKVPYEKADELWNRFNTAKDIFFNAKRQNAEEFRVNLEDNYAQKLALVKRAEQLKNSLEWREATIELNDMMAEWKKIGPVPREFTNIIWKQFIDARTFFFDRKDADREKRQAKFLGRIDKQVNQTKTFLEKLKEEQEEEEDRLKEFTESISSISGDGPKDTELKSHLEALIQQLEKRIPTRRAKIIDVEKQLKELLKRNESINDKKKSDEEKETDNNDKQQIISNSVEEIKITPPDEQKS